MSLVNVAYASRLTWANSHLDRLEDQALTPMFGEAPVEMGLAGREAILTDLLQEDEDYHREMARVFSSDENPYSVINTVRAISAFVRSIVSFDSPYDAFLNGDLDALDASAQRGMDLFFSERLECFHCHGGFNFTDSTTHVSAAVARVGFHNTGLYNLNNSGAYPSDNTGLIDITGERRDMGRFKAPSLRNIAVTAPYMHDGSVGTLEEVIANYERGGRLLSDGPYAGDGRLSPYKSEFVRGFELSEDERADLIAFLHALTDDAMLTESRWSDPFVSGQTSSNLTTMDNRQQ
jgi:cytochrome c peroxidase